MSRLIRLARAVIIACLVASCAFAEPLLKVAVSIPPEQYMVERLGGPLVEVVSLIPSGMDPHTYEPKPSDLSKIGSCSVFFAIGLLEFEKIWLPRISKMFPHITVINLASDLGLIGRPRTDGFDPHIWLDPLMMLQVSRTAYRELKSALISSVSANSPSDDPIKTLDENYRAWAGEVVSLDQEISAILAPFRGKPFVVYHPAWGYFARAYGLKQVAVEEEGKPPGPSTLKEVAEIAKAENLRVMFVFGSPPPAGAERLAGLWHMKIEALNPLAYDWKENLLRAARLIAASFGESG